MECATCGKSHDISELELFFQRPDFIFELGRDERQKNCVENNDICVYKGERFFVRGLIPFKISVGNGIYRIGAWAEVDEESFKRIYRLWDDPNQNKEKPFSGKLANEIKSFKKSRDLDIEIRLVSPDQRCEMYLIDKESEIFQEQTNGINDHRAFEISSVAKHYSN